MNMDRISQSPRVHLVAITALAAALALALGLVTGCRSNPPAADGNPTSSAHDSPGKSPTAHGKVSPGTQAPAPRAVADIRGAGEHAGKISGQVTFTQVADGVRVVADVSGLSPGKHGFHVHENPDLSTPDLRSAGPDFNPEGTKHGGPDSAMRHAGDLGNLTADAQGHGTYDRVVKGLSVYARADGVIGHSVVIHADEDDLKTDPDGNSGPRIAAGVIARGDGERAAGAVSRPATSPAAPAAKP